MATKMEHSNADVAHAILRIVPLSCWRFIKIRSERVEMGVPKVSNW